MQTLKHIAIALFFTLGVVGCGLNPQDKQDSVEITPQSTGQIAVESFSEQDSLTGTLAIAGSGLDNMSLENKFSISSASGLGKKGLSKIRSSATTPKVDLSDTAQGIARLMYFTQQLLSKDYDTIVVKWDVIAKDSTIADKNIISVSGAKVYIGGRIERYGVIDLDNDGVVSGQAQYNGKARFTYQAITNTTVEKLVMDVSAGADRDFNTDADNQILALAWNKTTDAVTVASATFADADNDGVLIDKSKTTPSIVDIILYEKSPPLKPFVDSTTLAMRVMIQGNDSNSVIIRLSGEEHRKSGRVITIGVTDVHGNVDVMPYDTAVATFAAIPVSDFGWKDSAKFIFDVQSGLQNGADNLLYELHLRKEHQAGVVLSRTFDFTTTQPVRQGQKPQSGHLEMTVTFSNGKTASIVAEFDRNGFTGTWTGPNGNTVTVTWDNNGNAVS